MGSDILYPANEPRIASLLLNLVFSRNFLFFAVVSLYLWTMLVNPKKPISFLNNTKYFSPEKDKVRITVASPSSWQSKTAKQEGYEARLYWHYKYCTEKVDGQVFYYTLTYNDDAIPKYFGINCFDYEDLRYLLTGGFRKQLLRKYGTTFKYFIGAELGDGKGSRGMHCNPHYHVLFFLEPDKNGKFPYTKIEPKEFRHLVKMYWQGFDESPEFDGYRDYRLAKYGIAKEGDNIGLVNSFAACVYCAKYVTKDAALKCHESRVRASLRVKFADGLKSESFYQDFLHSVIYSKVNVPLNPKCTQWAISDSDLALQHFPGRYDWCLPLYGRADVLCTFYKGLVEDFVDKFSLEREFREFYDGRLSDLVEAGLSEYRNRYCNKCRISHGVGDYALEELRTMSEPLLSVPSKNGPKWRPLSLYYYRKLFTTVVRPIEPCMVHCKPVPMSPVRILNEEGIIYRIKRLQKNISDMSEAARVNFELVLSDAVLWRKMQCSDVNTDCFLSHESLIQLNTTIHEQKRNVFLDYSVYKLVYEGRYFSSEDRDRCGIDCLSRLDYIRDYAYFIVPSYFSVSRSDIRLDSFLKDDNPSCLPYSELPYFRSWCCLYSVFDLCADYFAIQDDDKKEKDVKERARIKRFHDGLRLKEYYSHFK